MFQGLSDFMIQNQLSWNRDLKMLSDWEIAERHAWSNIFDVRLLGCLFHFGQAIWRKVQGVGLSVQYVSIPDVRVFVWHLLSMAHVPPLHFDEGLQVIQDSVDSFNHSARISPSSQHLADKIVEVHTYYLLT